SEFGQVDRENGACQYPEEGTGQRSGHDNRIALLLVGGEAKDDEEENNGNAKVNCFGDKPIQIEDRNCLGNPFVEGSQHLQERTDQKDRHHIVQLVDQEEFLLAAAHDVVNPDTYRGGESRTCPEKAEETENAGDTTVLDDGADL